MTFSTKSNYLSPLLYIENWKKGFLAGGEKITVHILITVINSL